MNIKTYSDSVLYLKLLFYYSLCRDSDLHKSQNIKFSLTKKIYFPHPQLKTPDNGISFHFPFGYPFFDSFRPRRRT